MRRTSGKDEVCFENLEQALAERPETYGHLDLLCGGWPCQDNSLANKDRKGHAGEKSGLWSEFRRLIELFRPRWIVAENVPGLFTVNYGKDFWGAISDLNKIGYCVAWTVLDSQRFGVAQRRERVFIVASLGTISAAKVLFDIESNRRDDPSISDLQPRGLCISTRDEERQDPTAENFVASVITATDYGRTPIGQYGNEANLICTTIKTDSHRATRTIADQNLVAYTISTDHRGDPQHINQTNLVAEIDTEREGAAARVPKGLDTSRGIVIGNAVTVPVAQWIGERIIKYDNQESMK